MAAVSRAGCWGTRKEAVREAEVLGVEVNGVRSERHRELQVGRIPFLRDWCGGALEESGRTPRNFSLSNCEEWT